MRAPHDEEADFSAVIASFCFALVLAVVVVAYVANLVAMAVTK